MSPRISLLVICLLLGILPSLYSLRRQSQKNSPPAERAERDAVGHLTDNSGERDDSGPYRFDQRANALVRIIFPPRVYPSGYARAYVERARTMNFGSKDDALLYHAASINGTSALTEPFEKAREATETFWRSAHPSNRRAQELFEQAGDIATLVRGMVNEQSTPTSLFEKALWQRDLICSLQAVLHCQDIDQDSGPNRSASALGSRTRRWGALQKTLLESLQHAIFTAGEYDQFRGQLRLAPGSKSFASQCTYTLTENYLPPVVWHAGVTGQGSEASENLSFWHELPSDEEPGLHFQAYGGRSFIRIFMMTPGLSEAEFFAYWAKVTRQFGMNVTVSAAVPSLPAGTQTVLLRTFGLFLDDGTYADSGVPEEVLVRVLKYTRATLDPRTSDGLGTLHYQYKLRRHRFLTDPATLGLERIRDEDGQFYGFFAEVPEPTSTEHLTTMRANCIGCHSELLYGASTVFSLCRRSPARPGPSLREGSHLEKKGPRGWLVKEEPLHTIQQELIGRLGKKN